MGFVRLGKLQYVLSVDVCKSQEQPVDLCLSHSLPLSHSRLITLQTTVSQLTKTGLMSFRSHVSVGGRDDQIDEHMIVTQDIELQVFWCNMEIDD